jgi:hypothetical protein
MNDFDAFAQFCEKSFPSHVEDTRTSHGIGTLEVYLRFGRL